MQLAAKERRNTLICSFEGEKKIQYKLQALHIETL